MNAAREFRHAPQDWSASAAEALAAGESLVLGDDHWEVIRSLQEFGARNAGRPVTLRALTDALEEKFHHKGGRKYLYALFPGGPVAQGSRLAGVKAPPGATDKGFGSVA